GVVEWLMAPVLKTGDPQGSVGSNPTPSVLSDPSPRLALELVGDLSFEAPPAAPLGMVTVMAS
ncbi:MAG: hypothetical protein ACKN89_15315, partial [Cyanobium sp.]